MIVFEHVSKIYPGGNTALKDVSLHLSLIHISEPTRRS